ENIAVGLRQVLSDANIEIVPMADGGEGTAEVIGDSLEGSWLKCKAHDPLGREIEVRYVWIADCKLAIMEMSEAAGMRRVAGEKVDVDLATTFGVGEMLLDGTRRGAREIIIGLGGSATNDGGVGMARALGFRFFNHEQEHELTGAVSELTKLARIARPSPGALRPPLPQGENRGEGKSSRVAQPWFPRIIAAVDVRNPLLGPNGATRVFGPQKGATPDKIDILERALTRLADVVAKEFAVDYRNEPGAGAAGGLGFALMSFCGAKIRPGFDVVAEAVGLAAKLRDVDVVITGEGSLDRQTLEGKTPAGVARLARELGKRVFAIVGRASEDRQVCGIFDGVYELGGAIEQARGLLRKKAAELARQL
ncbi:MAG TPA: glycerate kinase, partial [Chthoniobacterales bacterium]|nr:glycerate kinase [Chthoniobacterales bacterium]